MNLEEYTETFESEILSDSVAFQIPPSEAFLIRVADQLVESEVVSDYEIGYFNKIGRKNRQLKFDGYHYEDADSSLCLFIVDDLNEKDQLLNNALIDKLCKMAEEVIYMAIEGRYTLWEESSHGYQIASQISRLFDNRKNAETDYDIKKIRVFIITNKIISKLFKNEKRDDIYDIPVELNIYDMSRLFDMAKTGFAKESVTIDFSTYGQEGVYGVQSIQKEGEFTSYLATIPGDVLADIYLENGTSILEGNVRSFLSVRGKVNKSIRKTILDAPEKFFVLNNGITVTSDNINSENTDNGLLITQIENMQIVNGGQTTASLANAKLKDKADLSRVQVMMKLTVLDNRNLTEELVPEISRASNSQNKVDEADFFSNHPFHIKLQELSERNLAPAIDGNQYQTVWFYERARGQYTVQEMKKTVGEIKAWRLRNPKSQVLRKTDVAKYYMAYDCKPDEVSKGAQFVMKKFAEFIQGTGDDGFWNKNSSDVNNEFYRDIVSKAILFKETEKIVSNLDWYKEVKAYRANIVAYTISVLAHESSKLKKTIHLKKIWNAQKMYPELIEQIKVTSNEVYDFLVRDDRTTQNVTEWAKKSEAWKRAKNSKWTLLNEFVNTLYEKEVVKSYEVTESIVDSMTFVYSKNINVWKELLVWGRSYLYLTPKDESFINLAIDFHLGKKVPTDKQFKAIVAVYNMLQKEGFKE